MIVYIESNFILEIAALQEQHPSCLRILELAEGGQIRLVLPAFSVAEPYDVVRRRSQERQQLHDRLKKELRLLSRSTMYEERLRHAAEVAALLIESDREERRRLDDILVRTLQTAEIIPVDSTTLQDAIRAQTSRGLGAQDSIIYASVVQHLRSAPPGKKGFLNRNAKDFLIPDIQQDLRKFECRLISSFEDGLNFIQSQIGT